MAIAPTQNDIAEQLKTNFLNVGPNLPNKLNDDAIISPTQYVYYFPSSSFLMSPLSEFQVFTLFANLDEKINLI